MTTYSNKIFSIPFKNLKEGTYFYEYTIDNKFFESFEFSEIKIASLNIELELEKKTQLMILHFKINGTVSLPCDICLEDKKLQIETEKALYVKFGAAYSEETDEIITISSLDNDFNFAHFLYEVIHLALPMKRSHSNLDKNDSCNPDMIALLENNQNYSKDTDERWGVLKNLLD